MMGRLGLHQTAPNGKLRNDDVGQRIPGRFLNETRQVHAEEGIHPILKSVGGKVPPTIQGLEE